MKHIFLDTNIFLHFQDFEKINWLTESLSEECTIIIAPIVIDELDEKKIGTNRIATKARKILNRFEELSENEISEIQKNIFFKIELSKPSKNIYEINDLNFDEQDHRLIASIIKFKNDYPLDDVLLCTNDVGPRLRAKQFNIGILKLKNKYLLPNQISEEEKKIKKLEQENISLKTRVPKLALLFDNSKEFIKIPVKKNHSENFQEYKQKKIAEIKAKFSYKEQIDPFKNPLAAQLNMGLSNQQIKDYNNKIDEFYASYEEKLDEIYEFDKRVDLTFDICLIIKNTGNIPADEIDIHLHFPDGFELIESKDKSKMPELPKPPYKPKNRLDFGFSSLGALSPMYNSIGSDSNFNLNSPTIKKTNSYDVDFYRKNLKHGYKDELEELSLIFADFNNINNFKIKYQLSAANIPDKIIGELNIVFEK